MSFMRRGLGVLFLMWVSTTLFLLEKTVAQNTLILNDTKVTYSIDSSPFETIRWLDTLTYDSAIVVPDNSLYLNNPNTKEAYWIRLNVKNANPKLTEWILVFNFYSLDEIDIILKDSQGVIEKPIFS